MKTFASLAMIAVAASAVDMQVQHPDMDIFASILPPSKKSTSTATMPEEPEKAHKKHQNSTVQVDDQYNFDSELMELMNEITDLSNFVDEQGNTLMVTQQDFADVIR